MRTHDDDLSPVSSPASSSVLRHSEGAVLAQRSLAGGEPAVLDSAAVTHLQRRAGNAGTASLLGDDERSPVLDVVGSGGSPLDGGVRAEMESSFGHDFGDVRIHTDSAASASATSVHAQAYTVGNDIVFGEGRYAPETDAGRQSLAHELAHVVQQRSGPVDGTPAAGGVALSHPSDSFEQAAEGTAAEVGLGQKGGYPGAGPVTGNAILRPVQRQVIDEKPDKMAECLKDPEAYFTQNKNLYDAAAMLEFARLSGVKLNKRIEVVLKLYVPTYVQLDAEVMLAGQPDRDDVSSDDAMLGKIKGVIDIDDFLTLLTHLQIFRSGTTAEDDGSHARASEADSEIRKKLGIYLMGSVGPVRQIEGAVGVVAGPEWDDAGEKTYGKKVWFNGKMGDGVDPKRDTINGFVDQKGRVWINKDRGNAGTMFHEAMHKYSDSTMYLQQQFNEGNTEYFTRKVTEPMFISRGNYDGNHRVATKLASHIGEATLAAGYFEGDRDGVEKALENNGGARADLEMIATHMENRQWSDAEKVIDDAKAPKPLGR